MKKLLLSVAAVAAVTVVSAQKILVLYYSETGTTKTVAEELQKQLGADIEAVEAVVPYTGNFQETIQRSGRERESGELPAIKPLKSHIDDYDIVFLGYPIWYGTYAMPVATLVKEQDFAGNQDPRLGARGQAPSVDGAVRLYHYDCRRDEVHVL